MNFCIRSTFSKDPGSAISEVLGPGLGPLYKISPFQVSVKKRFVLVILLSTKDNGKLL